MTKDTRDDGGPAFPTGTQIEQNSSTAETTVHQYLSDGMTLRDYFIAHAPAESWPEFDPVIPPCPVLPNKFTLLNDDDRRDWDNDRLDFEEEQCSESLRQFASANRAALQAIDQWRDNRNLQRRVQWPAYWADQMLKARNV